MNSASERGAGWRCFHCGEYFTPHQREHAAAHFGTDESKVPVCQMRMPGEHELLAALRRAEAELSSRREDIDPLLNALCSMRADHQPALQRAEEAGYARGLVDGRAHHDPAAMQLPTELDGELLRILGRPNFACALIASAMRRDGIDIPRRSEAEQAYVIFKLLQLYAEYGDGWADAADAWIEELRQHDLARVAAGAKEQRPDA